jgi:hypothetical protein
LHALPHGEERVYLGAVSGKWANVVDASFLCGDIVFALALVEKVYIHGLINPRSLRESPYLKVSCFS